MKKEVFTPDSKCLFLSLSLAFLLAPGVPLFSSVTGAALGQSLRSESSYYDEACRLKTQQRYRQALDLVSAGLKVHPNSNRLLILEGNIWWMVGELELSEKSLMKASRQGIESMELHWQLAHLYRAQGKDRQALAEINRALALCPDCIDLYNDRSAIYKDRGEHLKAANDCSKALSIMEAQHLPPATMFILRDRRAGEYIKSGLYDKAIVDLEFLLATEKKNESRRQNLIGECLLAQGKLKAALSRFDAAIKASPLNLDARRNRLKALTMLRDDKGAAQERKQIENIEKDFSPFDSMKPQ
ncbi:MAG: tetratricopeptide repeat protein [Candidatus Obscuribacter sp.]|nr:tetratricopeptide repeat protein [Candidatus Obscuribacter sp.]